MNQEFDITKYFMSDVTASIKNQGGDISIVSRCLNTDIFKGSTSINLNNVLNELGYHFDNKQELIEKVLTRYVDTDVDCKFTKKSAKKYELQLRTDTVKKLTTCINKIINAIIKICQDHHDGNECYAFLMHKFRRALRVESFWFKYCSYGKSWYFDVWSTNRDDINISCNSSCLGIYQIGNNEMHDLVLESINQYTNFKVDKDVHNTTISSNPKMMENLFKLMNTYNVDKGEIQIL